MNTILTLIKKQSMNIVYNSFIVSSLIAMPMMAWLMTSGAERGSIELENIWLFFILMNTVANGVNMMACLISEEKEQNTLNVLMTSTVSASEFLISNLLVSFLVVMLSNSTIYFLLSGHDFISFPNFLFGSFLGSIVAILIGAIVGIFCKSQMIATSVAGAIGFFSIFFTDILYVLNLPDTISNIAYQIYPLPFVRLLMTPGMTYYEEVAALVLGDSVGLLINIIVLFAIFIVIYKKKGLEGNR